MRPKLIVGLGNPGTEYEHTRHNVGCAFVNCLANNNGTDLKDNIKLNVKHGFISSNNEKYHLIIPISYMNVCGIVIKNFCQYYKISSKEILVIHDELDLAAGEVKLKLSGGHAGHNGLRDIIKHFQTKDFYRLRIGIGHPGNKNLVSNYVLKKPDKNDSIAIGNAIEKSIQIMPDILAGNFETAMNKLH